MQLQYTITFLIYRINFIVLIDIYRSHVIKSLEIINCSYDTQRLLVYSANLIVLIDVYIDHQIVRNNYFSLAITIHIKYRINLIVLIDVHIVRKSLEIITSHLQLTYTTTLLVYRINLIVLIDI